eukprot:6353555-Amphidinium_carterae.1
MGGGSEARTRQDARPRARARAFPAGLAVHAMVRRNSSRSSSDQSRGHPLTENRWMPSFPRTCLSEASSSLETRMPK